VITLKPYQQTAVNGIRANYRAGRKAVLLVMPTGSGKTVTFSYICQHAAARNNSVLILAHRAELIDQISTTLKAFDVEHGIMSAGSKLRPTQQQRSVIVGSTQTVINRLDRLSPDLIITDEAHHATSVNTLGRIYKHWYNVHRLGVTATPCRLSGEGLGDCYDSMVQGPTTQQLIDSGDLSPVTVFAPPLIDVSHLHTRMGEFVHKELSEAADKPSITGDAVEHYKRLAAGKRAVVFCVSVDHARHVAAQFNASGVSALHIDGSMPSHDRKRAVTEFKQGAINVLTSCDLISEGFDCPGIEVGISLRPTASLGLWIQQVGRCLRTFDGKSRALILDHAGNTLRHGLPTEDRSWTLEGSERARRGSKDRLPTSVRVCPKCFSAQRSGGYACQGCGHVFKVKGRTLQEKDGELKEVTEVKKFLAQKRKEQASSQSLESLTELGRQRGYRDPRKWAMFVLSGRQKKRVSA